MERQRGIKEKTSCKMYMQPLPKMIVNCINYKHVPKKPPLSYFCKLEDLKGQYTVQVSKGLSSSEETPSLCRF